MKAILALDPGESTGWCCRNKDGLVYGGTCGKSHVEVADLIMSCRPDIVVLERFNLYPQMAKSLAWNSFYPCEVIGVIKYTCAMCQIPYVEQAPSIKKYAGGFKEDWQHLKDISPKGKVTEHTKDAYLHYRYYIRNKE